MYDELYHHGILGQKWGVRRYQNEDGSLTAAGRQHVGVKSVEGTARRALAGVYSLNAKTYDKLGNKTLASMNRAERSSQLKKAAAADQKKARLVSAKREKKELKAREAANKKEHLRNVDPELAKNKQTRRVAYDYHNLDDGQFRRKYKTSRKKFAKRYVKSKGNTYGMGLRRAAVATLINTIPSTTHYYRHGRIHTIRNGKRQALSTLAMDIASSEVKTRAGYNKAERTYYSNKKKNKS